MRRWRRWNSFATRAGGRHTQFPSRKPQEKSDLWSWRWWLVFSILAVELVMKSKRGTVSCSDQNCKDSGMKPPTIGSEKTKCFFLSVCVWNIWRDVKLLTLVISYSAVSWISLSVIFNTERSWFSYSAVVSIFPEHQFQQGAEGSPDVASANEAPHWISGKRTCNFLFPFRRQWQPAKPRTGMSNKWKITIWFRWNCCI